MNGKQFCVKLHIFFSEIFYATRKNNMSICVILQSNLGHCFRTMFKDFDR